MRLIRQWFAPSVGLGLCVFGGCSESPGAGGLPAGAGSGGFVSAGTAGASRGGAGTVNGGASAGDSSAVGCDEADCGPRLGLLNWTCPDGSVGGPTGRCLARPGGTCGWEVNNCPMSGEGGGPQGGQANVAGETATGGAAAGDCGGCSQGEICVFQVGGPGPSHFVCATQNPCGSAAACACIVGQGYCEPNLMGDPPRYCSCDHGLD